MVPLHIAARVLAASISMRNKIDPPGLLVSLYLQIDAVSSDLGRISSQSLCISETFISNQFKVH